MNDAAVQFCVECDLPIADLSEGTVLSDRFEILSSLGRGGMGSVFKVHDDELDETVALKVLRADIAGSPGAEQRFRSEIKLARKISHPNVCRIFEFGRHGLLSYLVMEFIEGVDLRHVLRERGSLSLAEVVEVSRKVCGALQAIHDAGVIHRDLKAANIMLGRRGDVKLMDFGIAKSTDRSVRSATVTGSIMGTPEYMSPEQVRAEPLDARSDIYALGIVMFEMFTGEPPLRGATAVETLFKQLNEPAPLDRGDSARLPPPIIPILEKALAKGKEQRYTSASEMEAVLARVGAENRAVDLRSLLAPGPDGDTVAEKARVTQREDHVATVRTGGAAGGDTVRVPGDRQALRTPAAAREPSRPPPSSGPPARPRPSNRRALAIAILVVGGIAASVYTVALREDGAKDAEPEPTPTAADPAASGSWMLLNALVEGAGSPVSVAPRQDAYAVGENLVVDIDVPGDGYLNVLNIGHDDSAASVLFPNKFQRDNGVRAGQRITIPAPGAPFTLPASLPDDRSEQRTLVVVILSRAPLDAYGTQAGDAPLRQLSAAEIEDFSAAAAEAGPEGYAVGGATVTISR